MGVVNVKSTWVSNADATPLVLTSDFLSIDELSTSCMPVVMGATDSSGSTYRFGRINSGAVVVSAAIAVDANSGMTSCSLGVLETAANGAGNAGGVVGSNAIFMQTQNLSAGLSTFTEKLTPALASGSPSPLISNYGKRIWELLGLTADSQRDYDLVFTQVTAGSGGGNLAIRWSYFQ